MAEFLTTHKTAALLEDVIINARKDLTLISPYLQISELLLTRLKEANSRRVRIKIVYGKDELKKQEREKLAELNRLSLYYLENLHAKCYFNESHMVITSMNMYEFSEKHNREMGVLIEYATDRLLYEKAAAEAVSFIQGAKEIVLNTDLYPYRKKDVMHDNGTPYNRQNNGFCIRCATPINYDPSKPYCPDCYDTWAQFGNYNYGEKFCHHCGNFGLTSMRHPECQHCIPNARKNNYQYR